MSAQRSGLLPWGLAALAITLLASGFVVPMMVDAFELTSADLFATAITIAFSAVGALVATPRPGNPIGWIFLGVAVSTGLGGFAHGYVQFRLDEGGVAGAFVGTAATYAEVSWVPFVLVPPSFLLLLFPDGHLPSRRWRPVAWAAAAGIAATLVTAWVVPGPLADFPDLRNPYGIDSSLVEAFMGLDYLVLFAGVIGSAASVVVRFRRGRREQRQQIKWLAVAGGVAAVALIVNLMFYDALGDNVANGLIMIGVHGLPAAAGIGILRHRLYVVRRVRRGLWLGVLEDEALAEAVTAAESSLGQRGGLPAGGREELGLSLGAVEQLLVGVLESAEQEILGHLDERLGRET